MLTGSYPIRKKIEQKISDTKMFNWKKNGKKKKNSRSEQKCKSVKEKEKNMM